MKCEITGLEFILWLLKRRHRMVVENQSMLPTLNPGDEILVNRQAYASRSPQVGEIVVLQDPRQASLLIIKRVVACVHGCVEVRGDNPAKSTDSRQFGLVPLELLHGKVTCIFSAKDRP